MIQAKDHLAHHHINQKAAKRDQRIRRKNHLKNKNRKAFRQSNHQNQAPGIQVFSHLPIKATQIHIKSL